MKHLLTPLLGALTLSLSGCQDKPQPQFIRVENGRFVGGSANSGYFVGANFWYGALLATEGPGRDRDRLCRELDRLKASGIGNLRVLVGSEGNTGVISKVEPILQTAPGVYDDRALDGLDFLMSELGKRDMQAVLYLTNAWEWSGGYSQYLEWSGRGTYPVPGLAGWDTFMAYVRQFHEAEATDSCKILLEKHIRHIVTRTNRYTGRPYREDPAIFSWQIANEPRAFSDDNKERFFAWVARTAKLIKQLDPNHMVSTGSEGEMGCEGDIGLWRRIHALPEIDYANIHIWPYNWRWISQENVGGDLTAACEKTTEYIRRHAEIARELGKPLVIEEFGYPRDSFAFEPGSPTTARDAYYRHIFEQVIRSAAAGDIVAGCNFWGWGGAARPVHLSWQAGDDYCGDPAQEEQGLNSVFDNDHTTLREITAANRTLGLHAQALTATPGNGTPAALLRLLRETSARNRLLFGQQDFPFYGCDWAYRPGCCDVKACCGDYPAVLGCDLGEIELGTGHNLDGVPFDTMRREIVPQPVNRRRRMGCERPRHRTFGTAGRQKPCEIPRMGGSCGRFSQLPVHERRHDRSGVVSSLARAHRELVLVGTTALFDRRIRSTLENDRRTHARQGRTYAHRLFAQPVRHRTGIPRALSGGCMGRHTGAGCLPQQRCRGIRHAARGIARDHGSDRPRPPETLCRIGNRHGGYSACRLVDGGTDAGHRGAASRIRTGMEECLTDAKTRAFLRTLSRTGLAGRLQPVLCFATDVIRGRCSQRLSITNNIDSIFDNDQL